MLTRSRAVRGAVVLGLTTAGVLFAAPAQAMPIGENTIRSECGAAGGVYGSATDAGVRTSFCSYTDIYGDKWTDWYRNGRYRDTTPS
jgi:hypothetical protein